MKNLIDFALFKFQNDFDPEKCTHVLHPKVNSLISMKYIWPVFCGSILFCTDFSKIIFPQKEINANCNVYSVSLSRANAFRIEK